MSSQRTRRGGSRVATVLFAFGVCVTPIAALMIWFAHGGGPLRAAAVLAVLGTILIGLSVVLRRDPEGVRLELQENLVAETEAMREDLRSAMVTAMQRSNQAVHAEVAALQEQVDALRRAGLAGTERRTATLTSGTLPTPPPAAVNGGTSPVRRRDRRRTEFEEEHTGYGYYNQDYDRGAPSYSSYSPPSGYRPQDYPAPAADFRAAGTRRSRRHRAED